MVDVGAQVAGKIVSFGKDVAGKTIDYGSTVEEGTVLAQIDDSLYAADVAQSEGPAGAGQGGAGRGPRRTWASSRPTSSRPSATGTGPRSWALPMRCRRATTMPPSPPSTSPRPIWRWARPPSSRPRATSSQARPLCSRAQQNLDYCTIQSPVKGVIIDRRVNIGQTVVSSLNAPSLFLIAKDLKRLQVWVAVNEADIGNIRPGQPVDFHRGRFPGPELSRARWARCA